MAKILIARLGALGDILHALPAVTSIRAAFPDWTLGWLVEERWTELLTSRGIHSPLELLDQQQPVVNLIHTVNTKRWRHNILYPGTLGEMRHARRRVYNLHYDLVIDFQGAIKSAILVRYSGAAATAGFVDPREPAARFFYSQRFARAGKHVIEQNHALAAQALKPYLHGREFPLLPPVLPCNPNAEAWATAEIARLGVASFALLTPGAGWGGKQWPAERFGAVAQALAKHNLKSLVNLAPGEEALGPQVMDASGGHAFAVSCSVGQLIALTRRARIFIGGDTGPLHLAAALGTPCVGLFGPTDPARTGPFTANSIALRHPEAKTTFSHHREPDRGLLRINADEVIGAARHLLGGGRG